MQGQWEPVGPAKGWLLQTLRVILAVQAWGTCCSIPALQGFCHVKYCNFSPRLCLTEPFVFSRLKKQLPLEVFLPM